MVAGKKLSQKPGTIDLGLYYEMNARMVDSLDTYLFFLDDRSRVIETAALSSSLPFEAEEILTFTKELKVPQGIKAISFGYNGEARRDGDGWSNFIGGGGVETFCDLP